MGYGGTDPNPAKLWLHMLTRLNMKNEKRRDKKGKTDFTSLLQEGGATAA